MLKKIPDSITHRERLVAALQQQGTICSASVASAFTATPREPFVSAFYERVGRDWIMHCQPPEADDLSWLARIYQDEALVTQLDSRALPCSSSSQPSVMARMLEVLDVQQGQRVLEIGTGTGYNAALLAHLTGDPALVTTIELDERTASRAEQVLHNVVGPVQVTRGDGRQGVASRAPFDRIIVTASADTLARAWFSQLVPEGRLILPLQGSLSASGFLVVKKTGQEGHGTFLQPPLHFMPMRSEDAADERSSRDLFQQPILQDIFVEADHPMLLAVQERNFRWFLQWAWPEKGTLQILSMTSPEGKRALLVKDPCLTSILQLSQRTDGSWSGKSHGVVPLWSMIREIATRYQQMGSPGQDAFQVRLHAQHATLFVSSQGKTHDVRDLFRV
ncbi:MAG TPA: hypothetical protein VFV38_21285 [Ktedonobacteraceae bacterium]|nr:hypothetical protein [Ktedonobacteraceae bacterium]